MSFCAALMGGCKEAPAEIPVVGVEDVLVDNIEIYGDYVGLIKAASRVEINARVEGFLEKMTFEEGKRVRMNEPLFILMTISIRRASKRRRRSSRRTKRRRPRPNATYSACVRFMSRMPRASSIWTMP